MPYQKDVNQSEGRMIAVARAADDLRRGLPAIITGERPLLVQSAERCTGQALPDGAYLLITANRAETLKIHSRGRMAVPVILPADTTATTVQALADPTQDLSTPLKGPFKTLPRDVSDSERAALTLCRIARLLPAALVADITDGVEHSVLLSVSADDIFAHAGRTAENLQEAARAQVSLEGAENSLLISYRPASGGPEHMAILVGNPPVGKPPLVRLHSECFTGDLLGSLKCDCGKQLKGAIAAMAREGGGIVLYMAHEGRGIGLAGKIKAYALQDQGFDTVDANLRLGFDDDERDFRPAAAILKKLGHATVRLLTNNPAKVTALEQFGIRVAERIPHIFPAGEHSAHYLATKKTRSGHLL